MTTKNAVYNVFLPFPKKMILRSDRRTLSEFSKFAETFSAAIIINYTEGLYKDFRSVFICLEHLVFF